MTKEERERAIHRKALSSFDSIIDAVSDEREQCLEDRRFYSIAGAQWEGSLSEQFANKPKFEVNKVHLAVIRIINEYRNNRITVDFISKEGEEYDSLADTCDGLYRADESDSQAQEAYDNAFEEAVGGGIGAWRLRAKYVDEYEDEDERQRISIEPIYDADKSVFFDINSKLQDKSDANHVFILTSMSEAAYEEEYGDSPQTWEKSITQSEYDWASDNSVIVAEYFEVERVKHTVRIFETLSGDEERYTKEDFESDDTLEQTLAAVGTREVRQKRSTIKKIHKYILSGGSVLEDCGYIAGTELPVVPVYGKRWIVDGIERCMGHVRLSKDAQRLKNMQLSHLAEISALSPTRKPIFHPEQVVRHKAMWANDNIENNPYLLIDMITDADGNEVPGAAIGYTEPPLIPPALAALMQATDMDMNELLGNQQGADKMVSNISGDAVEMIQARLDMQSYIYMSNFAKSVKRSGEIWLSMAKDIYIEQGRKMKSIGSQGQLSQVELRRPMVNKDTGETEYENDLSEAKFDILTDVGPSSSSKRASTVRSLTGMMQITTDPETMSVLSSMAMMNMEGEGISEVHDYFRNKMIKAGVVKPTEEEAAALQEEQANQPPDPNTQYLQAAAQEAEAKAAKARADTIKVVADSEKIRAETEEILANMEPSQRKAALESAKVMLEIAEKQNSLQENTVAIQPMIG